MTRTGLSTTTLGPIGTETGIPAPFPNPSRHADETNSFRQISRPDGAYLLDWHFGSSETTLIAAELYISPESLSDVKGLRAPDLLIAFDVDPEICDCSNAYVISEQGKPPDRPRTLWLRKSGHAPIGKPRLWKPATVRILRQRTTNLLVLLAQSAATKK